ncbi:hypothetical protein GCM10010521_32260 [Streptomyces rameus]|uniref:Uncharacterized protein n=1 Tax=Streptomyces rameus TaxID=68261 RepID=A0ABP6NC73_9ACTN
MAELVGDKAKGEVRDADGGSVSAAGGTGPTPAQPRTRPGERVSAKPGVCGGRPTPGRGDEPPDALEEGGRVVGGVPRPRRSEGSGARRPAWARRRARRPAWAFRRA